MKREQCAGKCAQLSAKCKLTDGSRTHCPVCVVDRDGTTFVFYRCILSGKLDIPVDML